ncbi:MAG: trypsin-like peptidase domain-containing protein [Clostridia bacterium]|nr:trypsin-like peptidase domain-containing protein [Clostridia bacterium]
MKNTFKKRFIGSALILTLILTSLFSLSSCGNMSYGGVTDAEINEYGELVIFYDNGLQQNLGVISNSTTNLTVENYGGDSSSAASKGLVSAVTVTSNFEKTVKNSYGGMFPGFGGSTIQQYSSEGSGVIYKLDRESGSAFIITNYHVVYDSSSNTDDGISDDIDVYLYGREYEDLAISATYVGGSLYYDIAVLYVENAEILKNSVYNSVEIANSDNVCVGDTAIAIGNPEGYGISASLGIVSVNSEYITMTVADGASTVSFRVIRVDTAVNSGNSGGGLYNDKGELIGIVNAKIVDETVENIAYAIPATVASAVAENIIDNCYGKENNTVMRAILGVTLGISDSHAVINDDGSVSIKEKVKISEISQGSPAEGILKVGDVVKSITLNGQTKEITRRYHIIDEMLNARVGDKVYIAVERDGNEITVEIVIDNDCIVKY